MNVVLIHPPLPDLYYKVELFNELTISTMPFSLAYPAAVLEREGIDVEIFDMNVMDVTWEDLESRLHRSAPDLVGITTASVSYQKALKIASIVKSIDPETIVVMGGPHVTFTAEETLKNNPAVDMVVQGEGELTLLEIVQAKGDIKKIAGITYRSGDEVITNPSREFITDLDALPLPTWHLFPMDKYTYPGALITSRGCPQKCIFCAAGAMGGKRYRVRSPEKVVDEIELLLKEYSSIIDRIFIADDTFTGIPKRAEKICDLILERNLKIEILCQTRVDSINEKLLHKMKNAGCVRIHFGAESGSQEILDSIGKNISLSQIRNAAKLCHQVDIQASFSLTIGHPYDTEQTIEQTMRLRQELQQYVGKEMAPLTAIMPYPGTLIYENPVKYGITIHERDWEKYVPIKPIISTKNLSRNEIADVLLNALIDNSSSNIEKEPSHKHAC